MKKQVKRQNSHIQRFTFQAIPAKQHNCIKGGSQSSIIIEETLDI
ncbi:MAG: hypothetical protein AAF990_27220 [Bacteroidota bacterium]